MDGAAAYRDALGRTVRLLRAERSWSLRTLSEASEVSVPYLSEIERGRKEPSGAMLAQLAAAFDLSLAALLGTIAQALGDGWSEALETREPLPAGLVRLLQELCVDDRAEVARYAEYLAWRRAYDGSDA